MRSLRLATQLLTRLPVRRIEDFSPLELSRSALWLPLVGLGNRRHDAAPDLIARQDHGAFHGRERRDERFALRPRTVSS